MTRSKRYDGVAILQKHLRDIEAVYEALDPDSPGRPNVKLQIEQCKKDIEAERQAQKRRSAK